MKLALGIGQITLSNIDKDNTALIADEGVEVLINQRNSKFKSKKSIIRTEKGEFNLVEYLDDTIHVQISLVSPFFMIRCSLKVMLRRSWVLLLRKVGIMLRYHRR